MQRSVSIADVSFTATAQPVTATKVHLNPRRVLDRTAITDQLPVVALNGGGFGQVQRVTRPQARGDIQRHYRSANEIRVTAPKSDAAGNLPLDRGRPQRHCQLHRAGQPLRRGGCVYSLVSWFSV